MTKRLAVLLSLLVASVAIAAVNINSAATVAANTMFVNSAGAAAVVRGKSAAATYTCTATGLVTTALYSMQLDSEAGRGLRVQRVCVGTSPATAAALQTITVQRRTTASTAGTAATAEGTASPAVSKLDQAETGGNFSGRCAQTPTLGTAGAVIDGWGHVVGELGAGAADGSGPSVYCRTYGDESEKAPVVSAGTANGISVSATAVGAGGLASGSISITFIAE